MDIYKSFLLNNIDIFLLLILTPYSFFEIIFIILYLGVSSVALQIIDGNSHESIELIKINTGRLCVSILSH